MLQEAEFLNYNRTVLIHRLIVRVSRPGWCPSVRPLHYSWKFSFFSLCLDYFIIIKTDKFGRLVEKLMMKIITKYILLNIFIIWELIFLIVQKHYIFIKDNNSNEFLNIWWKIPTNEYFYVNLWVLIFWKVGQRWRKRY